MPNLSVTILKLRLRHISVKETEPGRYRLGFRKREFNVDSEEMYRIGALLLSNSGLTRRDLEYYLVRRCQPGGA